MTVAAYPTFDTAPPCADAGDPDVFFAEAHEATAYLTRSEATAICEGCPFRAPCLDYALHHDVLGVWGGTSYRQRREMRRRRRIVAEPLVFRDEPAMRREIDRLTAAGLNGNEIATRLGVTLRTVHRHWSRQRAGAA